MHVLYMHAYYICTLYTYILHTYTCTWLYTLYVWNYNNNCSSIAEVSGTSSMETFHVQGTIFSTYTNCIVCDRICTKCVNCIESVLPRRGQVFWKGNLSCLSRHSSDDHDRLQASSLSMFTVQLSSGDRALTWHTRQRRDTAQIFRERNNNQIKQDGSGRSSPF